MKARRKPTFDDRVAEYVDSPMMTHRLRAGKQIRAQIQGNYGVYRTSASRTKKLSGECTCPSETQPCKHIHALRATWDVNPDSFFGLDDWLLSLVGRSEAELIGTIEQLVLHAPDCLSVFDIPGFDAAPDEYDEY